MDAERIRDDLISLLRETDKLSAHQFGLFFKGITHEDDEEVAAEMENIPIEAYEVLITLVY